MTACGRETWTVAVSSRHGTASSTRRRASRSILAIVTMLVLTITLTAVIFLTAAGARDAQRTNAGQRAYALAESGINNALAVL